MPLPDLSWLLTFNGSYHGPLKILARVMVIAIAIALALAYNHAHLRPWPYRGFTQPYI